MQCPACNYMMDSFDKECPRCQGKGLARPAQTQQLPPPPPPVMPPTAPLDNPGLSPALKNTHFCPKCGTKNHKTANHCSQCGVDLTRGASTFPWGTVIGWVLALGLVVVVFFAFGAAGKLIDSTNEMVFPEKSKKVTYPTKEELEEDIRTGLTGKMASQQQDVPTSERVTCTSVSLVKDSETDSTIKYTGFAELSNGRKTDASVTIDKSDGEIIWKTGDGV